MKKSILFMPVLISLSIVGCTMNYNQPSSDKVIHQSSLNIDKLINANAADVEKSLGSPYYATYYIDADKLLIMITSLAILIFIYIMKMVLLKMPFMVHIK